MVWHSQEAAKSTATPGKAAPKSEEAKGRALLGGLMPIWVWKKSTFFFFVLEHCFLSFASQQSKL